MSSRQKSEIVVSGLRTSDEPVAFTAYEENVSMLKNGVEFTEVKTGTWRFIPWHRVLEVRDAR